MAKIMILAVLAVLLVPPPATTHAEVTVDMDLFYNELAPYGDWFAVSPYGWVWCPFNVNPRWRPYSNGHWLYTDFGWTWVSDFEWGWAPFHYGRWYYDDSFGWAWVPGTTWGPAWVAWRYGDGYAGWAPLPPDVAWTGAGGLDWGNFNFDIGFQWYSWNFADEKWLCKPGLRNHIYSPERNVGIIGKTRNITRYTFRNDRIVNHGLDVDRFERTTHEMVPRLALRDERSMDREHRSRIEGRSLYMFRPHVSRMRIENRPPQMEHRPFDFGEYRRRLGVYHKHQIESLRKQEQRRVRNRNPGVTRHEVARDHEKAVQAVREHQGREKRTAENRARYQRSKARGSRETHRSARKGRR